jgi:hypothetical protein
MLEMGTRREKDKENCLLVVRRASSLAAGRFSAGSRGRVAARLPYRMEIVRRSPHSECPPTLEEPMWYATDILRLKRLVIAGNPQGESLFQARQGAPLVLGVHLSKEEKRALFDDDD